MLPQVPGTYSDKDGHLWELRDDGLWTYTHRRTSDGAMVPIDDYGTVHAEALLKLSREPGGNILPLTRVDPLNVRHGGQT